MAPKKIIKGKGFYASLPYYSYDHDGQHSIRLMREALREDGVVFPESAIEKYLKSKEGQALIRRMHFKDLKERFMKSGMMKPPVR